MIKPQSEASTQFNRKDIPCQYKAKIQQEGEEFGVLGRIGGHWSIMMASHKCHHSTTGALSVNERERTLRHLKYKVIPIILNLFATSSTLTIEMIKRLD